nr:hypothetical protein HmN_000252600 [Hymenolepis microstoma]
MREVYLLYQYEYAENWAREEGNKRVDFRTNAWMDDGNGRKSSLGVVAERKVSACRLKRRNGSGCQSPVGASIRNITKGWT